MQRHIQTTVQSLSLAASLLFVLASRPEMSARAQETVLMPVTTGEMLPLR